MSNTAYAGLFQEHHPRDERRTAPNRRVVFEHPKQNALAPVWSPDGDRIAFGLGAFFAGGRAAACATSPSSPPMDLVCRC